MGTDSSNAAEAGLFTAGDVIRKWRKAAGVNNIVLAERAGINKDTVTRIENGDPGVGMDVVESVVRALGKSMRELFGALDGSGRLTADEAKLLAAYRGMQDALRPWLIEQAEFFRRVGPPAPKED